MNGRYDDVRGLSLYPLYAALIGTGLKMLETRPYRPPAGFTGPLVICSTQSHGPGGLSGLVRHLRDTEHGRALATELWNLDADDGERLPNPWELADTIAQRLDALRGRALCVVRLTEQPVRAEDALRAWPDQEPYGNFAPGRWAWPITRAARLDGTPVKGGQRVWRLGPGQVQLEAAAADRLEYVEHTPVAA